MDCPGGSRRGVGVAGQLRTAAIAGPPSTVASGYRRRNAAIGQGMVGLWQRGLERVRPQHLLRNRQRKQQRPSRARRHPLHPRRHRFPALEVGLGSNRGIRGRDLLSCGTLPRRGVLAQLELAGHRTRGQPIGRRVQGGGQPHQCGPTGAGAGTFSVRRIQRQQGQRRPQVATRKRFCAIHRECPASHLQRQQHLCPTQNPRLPHLGQNACGLPRRMGVERTTRRGQPAAHLLPLPRLGNLLCHGRHHRRRATGILPRTHRPPQRLRPICTRQRSRASGPALRPGAKPQAPTARERIQPRTACGGRRAQHLHP